MSSDMNTKCNLLDKNAVSRINGSETEYESIKALAAASGVPFADLFRDAAETARKNDER